MRADARRNYEAIVNVARRHLTSQGVTTSLEAIADEAGVGIATLYRHFPDRDHLVFAALNVQGKQVRATPAKIRAQYPPDQQLDQWLTVVESYLNSYQGLPASMAHALEANDKSPLAITCQEMIEVTNEFVAEARDLGIVKAAVTGQILFEAALMVAWLDAQTSDEGPGLDGIRHILAYGYRT